jgi:HK97 family phage portal protein
MTSFVFRETLMTHLLLWGNAYAQIIRNGKGEVVALYPLMPNRMTVDRDEDGQLYYEYQTSQDEAHTMNGSRVRLSPSDVLHIPGLGFDGLWATARLRWQRTPSAWRLPVRNTELSSSLTARRPAASWSIPAW